MLAHHETNYKMMTATRFYFSTLILFGLVIAAGAMGLTGCSEHSSSPTESQRKTIVATTTMIADLVQVIAGEDCEVIGLMEPGVDPHTYELPARAIGILRSADLILYNGLLLEGKLAENFAEMKGRSLALAEQLPVDRLLKPPSLEKYADPHVWGDVALWKETVPAVVKALSELSPEHAADFTRRAETYEKELDGLDNWIEKAVAEIPRERRVLITSHDAFSYLGAAYEIDVYGVQGISTATEAGMADIVKTVDLIKTRGVKAIFVESSVSGDSIERIAKDSGVEIGGELFSDSCGPAGKMIEVEGQEYDVGTYIGMMMHNVEIIRKSLK